MGDAGGAADSAAAALALEPGNLAAAAARADSLFARSMCVGFDLI